jgi:hypothetical protein
MLKPFLVARVGGNPPYWTCWPSSRLVKATAEAAVHRQAATCFRKTTLVVTPPHSAHSNLWTVRSRRIGCRSMRASFIGLRHLGQVSFINRSKDTARPFVGSVADVLARTRRTICKNSGNAALALRRFRGCFRTPSPVCEDRRLELRRHMPRLIQPGLCGRTLF